MTTAPKVSMLFLFLAMFATSADAFHAPASPMTASFGLHLKKTTTFHNVLKMASSEEESKNSGVMELVDDEEERPRAETTSPVAPFLSQGEIAPDALNPDLSDPKNTRVIIYIIVSLLPVLFLIPLMLGSRDLIPAEMLPPVEL